MVTIDIMNQTSWPAAMRPVNTTSIVTTGQYVGHDLTIYSIKAGSFFKARVNDPAGVREEIFLKITSSMVPKATGRSIWFNAIRLERVFELFKLCGVDMTPDHWENYDWSAIEGMFDPGTIKASDQVEQWLVDIGGAEFPTTLTKLSLLEISDIAIKGEEFAAFCELYRARVPAFYINSVEIHPHRVWYDEGMD